MTIQIAEIKINEKDKEIELCITSQTIDVCATINIIPKSNELEYFTLNQLKQFLAFTIASVLRVFAKGIQDFAKLIEMCKNDDKCKTSLSQLFDIK
jgi:hypothetical protein